MRAVFPVGRLGRAGPQRRNLLRTVRKVTFAQARAAILATLAGLGWQTKPALKVPQAITPSGSVLRFRAQAVYLGDHSLGVDIRKVTPEAFASDVLATEARRRTTLPAPEETDPPCEPGCDLGFDVFNGREIQRCDLCQRFASDYDASEAARAILRLVGKHTAGATIADRIDHLERILVTAEANAQAAASRDARSAPALFPTSSRERVCQWLQWCDPNGSHLDTLAEGDPYSEADAWEALAAMVEGGR